MRILLTLCLSFFVLVATAQTFTPGWYVIEPGSEVAILKPGVNDLILYLQGAQKTIDRNTINAINDKIAYRPGMVVLAYDKVGEHTLATDIEGRTLLLKGELSPAQNKGNGGIGFLKETISNDVELKAGYYVWLKKVDKPNSTVTIQTINKKDVVVPSDKVYVINETTAELAAGVVFKKM